MNTKKAALGTAIALVMGAFTSGAYASLASDANLSIDLGNAVGSTICSTGSCFGMEVSPGFVIQTNISGFNGINLGTTQGASGSHTGAPDGSETPNIDNAWLFFSNTGLHQTISPVTILSDDNAGNVTLDFSGWGVTWNSIANIPMGSGVSAAMTCGATCGNGDSYSLTYAGVVPAGDPSSFGGVNYTLTLRGSITSSDVPPPEIPVPAAVWLFGSGLLGLVGVARRKKNA